MNPYLEQPADWRDFHHRLISEIAGSITPQIVPQFFAKVEEMVFIHEPPAEERVRLGSGDVTVVDGSSSGDVATMGTATLSPSIAAMVARLPQTEEEHHAYLTLRDRQSNDLVCLIEVLSPSNKRHGPDRETYMRKRTLTQFSPAHFVEIDLLRGGPRMPLVDTPPVYDYGVTVSRREMRPDVEFYPINLRDRLPTIPIPLRGDHPDAEVDLQSALHNVYDAAGYEHYLYRGTPQPPLSDTDAAWSETVRST